MKPWIQAYVQAQKAALDSIPIEAVEKIIGVLKKAHATKKNIFIIGNGGSAANASHFATDLGKSASDTVGKRFKVLSLNDNVSWLTALGNDYSYEDVYVGQLQNYAEKGDVCIAISVSGNSPNTVKALEYANKKGLVTIALVGGKRGKMADIAKHTIVIDSLHYGRVEDAQMGILHMICYAFIEHPEWAKKK